MTTLTHDGPDSLFLKFTGAVHHRFAHSRRVRVLAESIRDLGITPGRWLDIGCGDGRLAQAVMELVPGVDMLGVDVKPRPHAVIPVSPTDGRRLVFPNSSFTGALLVDVLHHAADPAAMLAEAARISRRSIIIKDHLCANVVDRCVLSFMDWFGNAPSSVDCPRRYLSLPQWDALFRQTRLNLEVMRIKLGLYPVTFRLLFERSMHFIARLTPINC